MTLRRLITKPKFSGANTANHATVVSNREFYFWFAEQPWGNNSFKLYSTKLDVVGTPVAEPATLMLLGLGLAAAARKLRRR